MDEPTNELVYSRCDRCGVDHVAEDLVANPKQSETIIINKDLDQGFRFRFRLTFWQFWPFQTEFR